MASSKLGTIGLGNIQEADNQLSLAAETYQRVLQLADDQPLQMICEAHLGLARVLYEWSDLDEASQHEQQGLHLARQYDRMIHRLVLCEVFLARLKLAQGDVSGAAALLAEAGQSARQQNFVDRMPEVAAPGQPGGSRSSGADVRPPHQPGPGTPGPGRHSAALAVLGSWRQQVEARGWQDERLKVMVLQAVALTISVG